MRDWGSLASEESINRAARALRENGMESIVVESGEKAKEKVEELLPLGGEVMTMTSVTLDVTGIADEINNSGKYISVKGKLASMTRETEGQRMQELGTAPSWTVGSVHAVTEDGRVVVASNTGSQLPAYAYGSEHIIWVVGGQKVVANLDEAMERVYKHSLSLESERAKKAYGVSGSAVNKMLVVNREVGEGRITVILVKEVLGF